MIRPLTGIRVIGLEQYISGPYCTMLLADAGAEVIKVERPGGGDPRRTIPPFVEKGAAKKAAGFMAYNRNKQSLVVDLRQAQGAAIYRRLVERADVVVENLRPGAIDKLGLGYEALRPLNPRLVYAAISGFGRLPGFDSPYRSRPAFDIVAEAMSGIMHAVGFADKPPSWTIYGLADLYAGMVTAYGIMQALFMRERTGEGQFVDSAMYDNMLALNERMITLFSLAGQSVERGRLNNVYPRGAFQAKDGYIALLAPDDRTWARICQVMGRPDLIDDPRSSDGAVRAANREFLAGVIEDWLAGLTRAEVVEQLNTVGVPVGPVQTAEDIFADPHLEARQLLLTIDDPEVGAHHFARSPLHLSAAPQPPLEPAPGLGQHTRQILESLLGYSSAEVEAAAAAGVIQLAGETSGSS